ncbi:MAG: hypothetical protein WC923_00715 [Bacteroidales bacterium]|nr:hypothetical protein [Bacteroidales bacterium]
MDSKEYKEIKDLLVQLEQKIEALYKPVVDRQEEQVFELDSHPEPEPRPEPEPEPGPWQDPSPEITEEIPSAPETVGDLFSGFAQRPTLADSLAKTKNARPLKEVIPLNDRFLYEKVLFSQDRDLYNKTLTDLQDIKTMQEAEAYLAKHFPHWELSSPAVQKFLTQLEDVF